MRLIDFAPKREQGSADAVLLLICAVTAYLSWAMYQPRVLQRTQTFFDAFTEKTSLHGVKRDERVWLLPLPPRTDYGVSSHRPFSLAECWLRRELVADTKGLPICP